MAKVQLVTYSKKVTINTGDFQNVQPSYEATAALEEGDSPRDVLLRLKNLVDSLLDEEVQETRAALRG